MTYQQITALIVIAVVIILSIFDIVMAYLSGEIRSYRGVFTNGR